MSFNPMKNYRDLTDYYTAMAARFDMLFSLVKFILLLVGVITFGWTAIAKITTDDIQEVISLPQSTGQQVLANVEKKFVEAHGRSYAEESAPLPKPPTPLYIRMIHHWAWLLLFFIFGYFLAHHSMKHVGKFMRGDSNGLK